MAELITSKTFMDYDLINGYFSHFGCMVTILQLSVCVCLLSHGSSSRGQR